MRSIKLALLGTASLLLAGCPMERPKVDICTIRADEDLLKCENPSHVQRIQTIKQSDGDYCYSPSDNQKIMQYVFDLEKKVADLEKQLASCK